MLQKKCQKRVEPGLDRNHQQIMASHAHLDRETSAWLFSERLNYKGGKRRSIQTVVQSQKAATVGKRMSPNQDVCKDTARSWIALFTTPLCKRLGCPARRAPYLLSAR